MAGVAWLRQQHHLLWPAQRDRHRRWPAQRRRQRWPVPRHRRQWRAPPHRRSARLPRHSVQPWSRMHRHASPPRRARPHRILQRHDPRSIAPRRRSDRP
jgi:hypothetical protein